MDNKPDEIPLDQLHFDLENPRYGRRAENVSNETDALNMIVSDFLVDDLLSSIAANGFFTGEPLIAKPRPEGGYEVLEGNRRLAALLILTNDPRAIRQQRRREIFVGKMHDQGKSLPDKFPVLVVEDEESSKSVLAYLGTKHVLGAKPWDSYAKARWMAQMLEETQLPLDQIKEMFGDKDLVDSMLEAYYVVEQVRETGRFDPLQSYIKGRGSNPEFPFSWVYTSLSLAAVRKFMGLGGRDNPKPNPLQEVWLENAGDYFEMIFGNKTRGNGGKPPVIKESRNLGDLAKALTSTANSARLREGVPLDVVEKEGKPLAERMSLLINEILERLLIANGIISNGSIGIEQARELSDPTLRALTSAKSLRDSIIKIINSNEPSIE